MTERKVAVVTAAAGAGIGGAVARRLASDGYNIVVTDKHSVRAEKFAIALAEEHGREFSSWGLDVADPDSVKTVFAEIIGRYGRIDLLVNNAGFNVSKPIVELTVEEWK